MVTISNSYLTEDISPLPVITDSSTYPTRGIAALKFITSIAVGSIQLDSTQWTTESLWLLRPNSRRFDRDESRHYNIWLRFP